MTLDDIKIDDRIILINGHKKGRKGIVVEIPFEGSDELGRVGILWDDNKSLGIQPVAPASIELMD